LRAGGGIRHHLGGHLPLPAWQNGERLRQRGPVPRLLADVVNARQRRASGGQPGDKILRLTGQAHHHPSSVVADVAFQPQLPGQLPDPGAKPHPLDFAANAQQRAVCTH